MDGYGINLAIARSQNSSPSKPPKMAAMGGYPFEVSDDLMQGRAWVKIVKNFDK
jgi:hypothetical protein